LFGEDSSVRRPEKYILSEFKVKRSSLKLESSFPKEKITFIKRPCEGLLITLLNLENSQVFSFSISTNVFGENLSSPPAGKIYFN
jgi:hypothetical protein